MPAIITDKFRLDTAEAFIDDLQGATNKHYVGIGRAHAWTDDTVPDTPYENDNTKDQAWENLYAAKKVDADDSIYCFPRNLWTSGTSYYAYDDQDTDLESKKYAVISDNNHVYICLKAGPSTSVTEPTSTATTGVIDNVGSDGYIWKYLFSLSATNSAKFLTTSFIPLVVLTSDPGGSADAGLQNQWAVQEGAVAGAIHHIKIVNGGTGYTSAPTVAIAGNGSSAAATATVSGGAITDIVMTNVGTGYDNAVVTVSGGGGSNGSLRAILPPRGGHGKDARHELRAHYAAINTIYTGDESGVIADGNDFRQIALIKNPTLAGGSTVATGDVYNTTGSLVIASGGSFSADDEIKGTVSGAKAIVVEFNSSTNTIYYNQNASTGYGVFDASTPDVIRLSSAGSGGQNLASKAAPPLNKYSGDVLFVENRTPVTRGSDQIETIRLVIAF